MGLFVVMEFNQILTWGIYIPLSHTSYELYAYYRIQNKAYEEINYLAKFKESNLILRDNATKSKSTSRIIIVDSTMCYF